MSQPAMAFYTAEMDPSDVRVSSRAEAQLAALLRDTDEEFAGIRVFVAGGGCGGMGYGMTYAENIREHDKVLDGPGYRLVVDAVALGYLQGCEIDYFEDGPSATFVFNNVFSSIGGSGACGGCGGGCGSAGGGCGS